LKNYFLIFSFAFIIIIITKFTFAYYLDETFSYITNAIIFQTIFLGYKFDFAVAAMSAFIITIFDFNKKILSLVASVILILLCLTQLSDIFYFFESSRHIGYEVKDALYDSFGLIMTALSQHTFLSITGLLFSIIFGLFSFQFFTKNLYAIKFNKYFIFKKILLIILTVFFVRGMFQGIPLNPWQSNQIGDSKLSSIALNATYNLLYTLANESKKIKPLQLPNISDDISKNEFKKLYNSEYTPFETNLNKPNVIIFFLESWSGISMKSYGFNKSDIPTTPFYDSILEKSIRPKAMIASGHRTTEGIFSSLVSFQNPLGKTVAKTQLQDFQYNSLIKILLNNGYESLFFQGSAKETSGTGSLAQSLGFQKSYGKHDIKQRIYEENYWGVHDPDLYNYVIHKLKETTKPFVIGINGATTHDNKIPKIVKEISFINDKDKNGKLNALHFSDRALKDFTLKIEKIYPNTLFVFMADHCGGVKESSFLNYMIPFALYHKELDPKYIDSYISQRDFTPTILDATLGNYKNYTNNFSGKSLFSDKSFFADYYHNGILGWVENQKSLELNTNTNKYKCYDLATFIDKEIECSDDIISFRNKALSFTKTSQNLLFKGKTHHFQGYK